VKKQNRIDFRNRRALARALPTVLWLSIATLFLPNSAQAKEITVHFKFYNEQGRELSCKSVVNRMTNGLGEKILSYGPVDLKSFKVLQSGSKEPENSMNWTEKFSSLTEYPKQGWLVRWNTEATGYSTFLLDNEGRGFSESGSCIFNERLALDAFRQFQESKKRKPQFRETERFKKFETKVNACFTKLRSQISDAGRGKFGQRCLDLVSQAQRLLMQEYGVQVAQELDKKSVWGVTIKPSADQNIDVDTKKLDDLADLFSVEHRWARLVMDGESPPLEYLRRVINAAQKRKVHVMGQLFDSTIQAQIPLQMFKDRVDRALAFADFEKFDAWEVGNEVNGSWTGTEMSQKIEYAAAQVKKRFPDKKVCLTFYWTSIEDTMESALFNWIETNVTPQITKNIDCVALSIYTDQQPLGFLWDTILTMLSDRFPDKSVIVGEMALADPSVDTYFYENKNSGSKAKMASTYIKNRYAHAFATPNSTGGGFWWYYDQEMVGKKPYWKILRSFYCSVYPKECR
jgi:hypothetical protein